MTRLMVVAAVLVSSALLAVSSLLASRSTVAASGFAGVVLVFVLIAIWLITGIVGREGAFRLGLVAFCLAAGIAAVAWPPSGTQARPVGDISFPLDLASCILAVIAFSCFDLRVWDRGRSGDAARALVARLPYVASATGISVVLVVISMSVKPALGFWTMIALVLVLAGTLAFVLRRVARRQD